jgi:plastocyanin
VDPGPGNTISYLITLNLPSTFNPNASTAVDGKDRLTVDLSIDTANFFVVQLSCFAPSGPSTSTTGFTAPEVGCEWTEATTTAGFPAGIYVFAVLGYAKPGADNKVGSPADIKFCYDQNGNKDCDDEPAANQLSVNVDASVGVLNINPNTVSPATTTVAPGTPVTITWTLEDGYTCESDNSEDTTVACSTNDVDVLPSGAATILSGPTLGDTNIADETTVTITILSPVPANVIVILKTKFDGDGDPTTPDKVNPNQFGVDDVAATVIFAGAPGRLMGDVDCDNNVTAADALKILRYLAGLPVVQNEPCPDIGTPQ